MTDLDTFEGGFTLLEVLVALIVVSLMFVGIFGFLGQLGNLNRISQDSVETNEYQFLDQYLGDVFSNSQELPILSEGFLKQHFMTGKASEITFVGKVRTGINGVGLFDITLRYDPFTKTLVEDRKMRRFKIDQNEVSAKFIVFENVEEFAISYLGTTEEGDVIWKSIWRSEQKRPTAIRMQIDIKGTRDNVLARRIFLYYF